MSVLRARAPGKVNLALYLGPTRASDGKHELVSLVEPVTLADWIEIGPARGGADEVVCAGVEGPNLAADAMRSFRAATGWDGPPVRLTIFKQVPVAAGMGGGSADAAAALRLLAKTSGLPVPGEIAAALGADVPAALHGGPAIMAGAGEHVTPVGELPPHAYLVLPAEAALSTAAVYAEADRLGLPRTAAELAECRAEVERGPPSTTTSSRPPARCIHRWATRWRTRARPGRATRSCAGRDLPSWGCSTPSRTPSWPPRPCASSTREPPPPAPRRVG